ncbi:hypothetical protein BC938DRAFT_472141 [Jimgerdemannia flammicorona]|uniref:Uncharacterized protein n=1 Tax=Jimgerdemannia flammicorona TaxID=994334 RepID=A0A433QU83_9FUNG|nr:hypothetical protein BC938DRAFT_472141 [Jimgerdemannia flammicorona]
MTYQVLDSITFLNRASGSPPTPLKTYSARETYGTPSDTAGGALDARWWHRVTERFESDAAMFDKYCQHRTSDSGGEGACDATCKRILFVGCGLARRRLEKEMRKEARGDMEEAGEEGGEGFGRKFCAPMLICGWWRWR